MDLVFSTSNSAARIDGCFQALLKSSYPKEKLNVYVIGNHFSDTLINKLEEWKERLKDRVETYQILEGAEESFRLGRMRNRAADLGTDEIICFFHAGVQIYEDTLEELEREINESDDSIAMWEMRQFPYEDAKIYDPIDGNVSWCCGTAVAVRRRVFEKIGGFDEHLLSAEDVDLSWRIRGKGYHLRYCPQICVKYFWHGNDANEREQYVYAKISNILLRYRYGSLIDILRGYMLYVVALLGRTSLKVSKRKLLLCFLQHFKDVFYWVHTREAVRGVFRGWDYEYYRDGDCYPVERMSTGEKVSIIVRTCNRPDVLKETLLCLRKQTYLNLEVIVVEDGENLSEELIKEFSDLDIHYYYTGEKKGRAYVGNLGLEKASGHFLNFLDDDDLFFNDHVEVLMNALSQRKEKAAYSFGLETAIQVKSKSPYIYEIKRVCKRYTEEFDRVALCHHNYIPIQSILFKKELFTELRGFDEKLDYLEDWDLWVRYATNTDFLCVPKTTSIYRVPCDKRESKCRQKQLDIALETVRKKHERYFMSISVRDIANLCDKKSLWEKGKQSIQSKVYETKI